MKYLFGVGVLLDGLALLAPWPAGAQEKKTEDNPKTEDKWAQLFNGKDLTGWKTHPDAPGDWKVVRGILIGRGPVQNYLYSERADYRDFHLRSEVKINPFGNAGIHFHVAMPRVVMKGAPSGYEAQIAGTRGDTNCTGSLFKFPDDRWLLYKVKEPPVPDDTWFTFEIIVQGHRVITRVNDKTLADLEDAGPDVGHIALQVMDNDVVVQFRKIEIKELPASPSGTP